MDTTLNIKSFSAKSIHACVAACGRVDRAYQDDDQSLPPNLSVLKENAGLTPAPEAESRDAMIAKGAYEWLQELHVTDRPFSLSNTSVKALHRKLFKHSPRDEGTRGNYRTDLDDEMKSLFEKTKDALDRQDRHTLFVISLFRVAFIDLMPFITGNAQCANLLTYALLINNNYPLVSQLSLVPSLNNPDSEFSQDPLVVLPNAFFKLLDDIDQKKLAQSSTLNSQPYLNSRRQSLLACINKNAPLKISDIMAFFPDQSRNTIKKDLLFL
ncbi:MAG: hypothetical protein U9Q91_04925, partial [Candidatus Marinimicrobia bacterium]|nr:hypothetical protein [Candidatus Neomarinimicrobiota bacterium]